MDFGTAIATFFKRYFDFEGRSSRAEYWWFVLFNYLIYIAAFILDIIIFGIAAMDEAFLFQGLWSLATLIGVISLGVRRLHDIDKTGFWFLYIYSPLLVLVPALLFDSGGDFFAFLIVIALLAIFALAITVFVFSLLPGTKGRNRFGENPLD
ncbi:DUF805 domain-containing protein [SAR86 cluster bacterium]|jgi:uncharacterized membrane protein YhaH (DUF805 family)|uniref:DUF805 domain-containing protein n=1 Tax=SAR86 cluster bacterium TaxID=2030880 RepID=A0A9Q8X497_9GAMM|nr:DUF805 domain-containing protein [SAR86 cluster bacterium]